MIELPGRPSDQPAHDGAATQVTGTVVERPGAGAQQVGSAETSGGVITADTRDDEAERGPTLPIVSAVHVVTDLPSDWADQVELLVNQGRPGFLSALRRAAHPLGGGPDTVRLGDITTAAALPRFELGTKSREQRHTVARTRARADGEVRARQSGAAVVANPYLWRWPEDAKGSPTYVGGVPRVVPLAWFFPPVLTPQIAALGAENGPIRIELSEARRDEAVRDFREMSSTGSSTPG